MTKFACFSFPQVTIIRVNGGDHRLNILTLIPAIDFVFESLDYISPYRHAPWFDKVAHKWDAMTRRLDLLFLGVNFEVKFREQKLINYESAICKLELSFVA